MLRQKLNLAVLPTLPKEITLNKQDRRVFSKELPVKWAYHIDTPISKDNGLRRMKKWEMILQPGLCN